MCDFINKNGTLSLVNYFHYLQFHFGKLLFAVASMRGAVGALAHICVFDRGGYFEELAHVRVETVIF